MIPVSQHAQAYYFGEREIFLAGVESQPEFFFHVRTESQKRQSGHFHGSLDFV